MELPKMALVEQLFDPQHIKNIPQEVRQEIARLNLPTKVKPGDSVAITAGSRGVANIDVIIKTIVDELKQLGAKPFIFPAMGSHGGATAEGQIKVLQSLGITESAMGCPIKSDMEPVYLGEAALGYPINVDRNAMEADHIVVVNRVKAHTKFEGPIESGLMKMMAIGMGKQKGAEYYHKAAVQLTFQKIVETVGLEVMKRCPILFGLATVENAYHQTCVVRALEPENIFQGEKELLTISKQRMAQLPFDEIDILIVDQIGKDISGTGMDTNVTGRNRDLLGDFTTRPRVKRVYVRDLTEKTEGNATGIGLADFTSTRLVEKMDRHKTWINVITGISPEKGAIPIYFDTDREVLDACFKTIGNIPVAEARVVHIKDTLSIDRISVSQAYAKDIEKNSRLRLLGRFEEMALGADGNIISKTKFL
ncbi:MAG: DUF2088 domain-containing protein [Deltaproteobacteria bacterium]|nr:DUF2088 domain-containing protein [Deltaproteobacteria bacterium]MBW1962359.1 DUF2088 domain-containing protein [Deltaproteobacteria bacterium]MBW1995565.1 DUF2088 domain-containing protein [Deltaproteobacteria bacterium]MBW2153997.1 DUF2088 domain-containing protein [Deltaproteobacteria bacterium]